MASFFNCMLASSRRPLHSALLFPVYETLRSRSCAAPAAALRTLQHSSGARQYSGGSLRASLLNPHAAVQSSGQRLRFNSTIASPVAAADTAALNAIPLKVHNPQLDENGKELTLDITDNAVKQLKHVAARDDNPLQALRITVDSGGCHGYQYLMGLTDTVNDDDVVFEKDGARVIVDTITLPMISGSRIDFIEELIGSAFKVLANPNAAHSCGCDTSFEIKI